MSARNKLRSAMVNALFSPTMRALRRRKAELLRRARRQPHTVTAFLQIDDPYSYLLATVLPALTNAYDIEVQLRLVEARGDEFQPAPALLAEYAITDCRRVAVELGIPFLDLGAAPPTERRIALTDAIAAGELDLLDAFSIYWRGDSEAAARAADAGAHRGAGQQSIAAGGQALRRLGHYNSATLHYGGEWYWGVDRLHYLMRRLDDLGVRRDSGARLPAVEQAMTIALPMKPPQAAASLPPLDFFVSLRSPYTALALPRVYELADAFGLDVRVHMVMPMVMRGMQIPRPKMLYIAADTMREAEYRGIGFGNFADPVGVGIERLYAVHQYARAERREREFLLSASNAIWAEGIDVATDAGLRKVTARTGLFWPEAVASLGDSGWRAEVEANRETLLASGSWGVPTLRLGDFVVWGQDRLWLMARHIEDRCASGDGILV